MIVLTFTEQEFRTMLNDAVRDALTGTPAPAEGPTTEGHIKGIKGLSAFLKVSHSRAQAIKNSGILPYFQTGKTILFDPAKVRDAMEKHAKRDRRAK